MVNTYAVQSGGCRFESLRGFGFCLKDAHYEVDYCGKKNFLSWTAMHIDFVMCKKGDPLGFLNIHSVAKYQIIDGGAIKKISEKMRNLNSLTMPKKGESLIVSKKVERGALLLWNGFLSHVRGFGCVENGVLSTHGKSA